MKAILLPLFLALLLAGLPLTAGEGLPKGEFIRYYQLRHVMLNPKTTGETLHEKFNFGENSKVTDVQFSNPDDFLEIGGNFFRQDQIAQVDWNVESTLVPGQTEHYKCKLIVKVDRSLKEDYHPDYSKDHIDLYECTDGSGDPVASPKDYLPLELFGPPRDRPADSCMCVRG